MVLVHHINFLVIYEDLQSHESRLKAVNGFNNNC